MDSEFISEVRHFLKNNNINAMFYGQVKLQDNINYTFDLVVFNKDSAIFIDIIDNQEVLNENSLTYLQAIDIAGEIVKIRTPSILVQNMDKLTTCKVNKIILLIRNSSDITAPIWDNYTELNNKSFIIVRWEQKEKLLNYLKENNNEIHY